MNLLRKSAIALTLLASTACYHVVVETGRPEGTMKIDRPMAPSFIFGLVPVPEIETASRCPNGIAKVDYQQDIMNSLVGIITFGLFTPVHVTVTCAAGGMGALPAADVIKLGSGATQQDKVNAFEAAVEQSRESGRATYVTY